MELNDILPKQDDPQRVLALNGVPRPFYLNAEEINLIITLLARLLGNESSLYKDEHQSLEHLEAAHPLPEPGSYAQITVVGGDNLKASWDNTDKKWFLDGIFIEAGSDAAFLLKAVHDTDNDGIIDKAKHIHDVLTAGGTKYYGTKNGSVGVFDFPDLGGGGSETLPSGFKVENFSNGYQGGLNWKPFANYSFNSNSYSVTANITIDTSTIPAGQKILAALVLNSNGSITLVEGDPSANPSAPNIDSATQMIPDGGLILLSSGAAVPDEVSLEKVYTNNSGIAGGEFDASIINGGARWNLASNEGDGVCIKGTALQANDLIRFLPGAPIPVGQFTEMVFKIHNLVDTGLTSGGGGFRFVVYGNYVDNRGRVRTSNALLPSFETGGYNVTSLDEQFVSLKVQSLSFYEITELRFVFDHADPEVIPTILLDDIKYNDGSAPSGENFATVGYVDRKTLETLQAAKDYADTLVLGGDDNVHDSYDTLPLMIADQANQLDGEYFIVVDASAHSTVDAGWAMFEYLGTTLGTEDDYRKLSEEESMDVVHYDYAQDIADVQAEVDALELRVTNIENSGGSGGGSSIPVSKTGTNIVFTEDALYNEITPLTTGDLTIDLIGAVKGVTSIAYCDRYIPQISGDYRLSGIIKTNTLNVLWFFYNGNNLDLMVVNKEYVFIPQYTVVSLDSQNVISDFNSPSADSYQILFSTINDINTASVAPGYNGTDISYTHTGLTNGTTYYYWIIGSSAGYLDSDAVIATGTPENTSGSLVSSYEQDEIAGTTSIDGTGVNDGTLSNITLGGAGKIGNGYGYNGTSSFVSIPGLNNALSGSFTIMMWMKKNSISSTFRLFDNRGAGGLGTVKGVQISVLYDPGAGHSWGNTAIDNGIGNYISFVDVPFAEGDNLFHFVALRFDTATGTAKLNIDGVLKSTKTDANLIGVDFTNNGVVLGKSNSNNQYFNGSTDMFRFFNESISDSEIASHYNGGNGLAI